MTFDPSIPCKSQKTEPYVCPELKRFHQDLTELGFEESRSQRIRQAVVGFSSGIRIGLSKKELPRYKELAKEIFLDEAPSALESLEAFYLRLQDPELNMLQNLRAAYEEWLDSDETPEAAKKNLLALSIGMGIKAVESESFLVPEMEEIFKILSPSQRFISERLLDLLGGGKEVRPLLIDYFHFSYQESPLELKVIPEYAARFYPEGGTDYVSWLLAGYGHGREFSRKNPELRDALFQSVGKESMEANNGLYDNYLGGEPKKDFAPTTELVLSSLFWCRRQHRHLFVDESPVHRFELIRNLYDFTFWMGLIGESRRQKEIGRSQF